jgi:hypothetical protein
MSSASTRAWPWQHWIGSNEKPFLVLDVDEGGRERRIDGERRRKRKKRGRKEKIKEDKG